MRAGDEARAVERRLSRAYLSAFAIVLVIFALAVHLAVWFDLASREVARLGELSTQARGAFEVSGGVEHIDRDGPNLADIRAEGVVWYDGAGRELAREGFVPVVPAGSAAGTTGDLRWATAPAGHGSVRVFVGRRAGARSLSRADLALGFGFLIALVAAGFGGRLLASRALVRIAQSMRTLRDFTADAAHELRGPLAAIRSNAGASLRADDDVPEPHRTRLQTIDATARAMARTIDDLLLIARSERPLERELYAIDVAALVREVVDLRCEHAANRGLTLATERLADARAYGSPPDVERIVGNLVDNAINYTPAGGAIAVSCAQERGGAVVRVRDSGIGIDPRDHERIFDRFWRGDVARRGEAGSGLGLPIVRALVRRHGGEVAVKSAPGTGSEFSVWLPARPPEREIVELAGPSSSTLSQP